ncbi:MAG: LysR family transcriptional regulator [Rhodospirillales bacterium]|nr:LysR family transcriptional regulator [Acetobacter sp.]
MLNRNHLALFRAVAEAGGFSRAAGEVHVSQPAISMQVAELESSLGTPLFERLPRGVRLTEAGCVLLGYAQRIAGLEAEAERAMRELRGLERGRLMLGASTTIGSYLLPKVLGEFRSLHPAIELQLHIANTEEITTRLVDRTLDLGLTEGVAPQDEAIRSRIFYEDELIVVAPPDHPFAASTPGRQRPKPIGVHQLCSQPFVVREPGSGTRAVVDRALADHGARMENVALTLSATEAIKRAVSAGLGLAVVSRLCVELELANGSLVEVPVRGLKLRRPLHELTLRDRRPSPSAQAFAAMLKKRQV